MPDVFDSKVRSRIMSSVPSKNSKIEIELRKRLFKMGFRYRLHGKDINGTPDLVISRYRTAVFVNGCFWHYHGCHLSSVPKTRSKWWKTKLLKNVKRDLEVVSQLLDTGWRVLVVWECRVRKPGVNRVLALDSLSQEVASFLRSDQSLREIPRSRIVGE